jgi:uncharacterized delta-60 repeat protein
VLQAGSCATATGRAFCAVRYNADGTLDTSFAVSGKLTTAILPPAVPGFTGAPFEFVSAILLLPNGKFILAGTCIEALSFPSNPPTFESFAMFCAVRYLGDGSIDTSFATGGKLREGVGAAYAAVLQPDGKFVIAGHDASPATGRRTFVARRFNADGSLDFSGSGASGSISTQPNASVIEMKANAALLQPDGKLVFAGWCLNATHVGSFFCSVRYSANGIFESGVTTALFSGNNDEGRSAVLQPDGKWVVAGRCGSSSVPTFCISRYLDSGVVDTALIGSGRVSTQFATFAQGSIANAVTIQPDGKLVLAGVCRNAGIEWLCALRYNPDGSLDASFGGGSGKLTTAITGGGGSASAVAIQADGKVLVGGSCTIGGIAQFCVARYDGGPFGYKNCSLDIDGDGAVLATTDSLIHARIALGVTGAALINGITFPATATRKTWPDIRKYLVAQCGMSLVP